MFELLFGEGNEAKASCTAHRPEDVSLVSLLSAAAAAASLKTSAADQSVLDNRIDTSGLLSGSLHGGSFVGVRDLKQAKQQQQQQFLVAKEMNGSQHGLQSSTSTRSGYGQTQKAHPRFSDSAASAPALRRPSSAKPRSGSGTAVPKRSALPEPEDFLARLERKRQEEVANARAAEKAKRAAAEVAAQRMRERQEMAEKKLREQAQQRKQEEKEQALRKAEEEAQRAAHKEALRAKARALASKREAAEEQARARREKLLKERADAEAAEHAERRRQLNIEKAAVEEARKEAAAKLEAQKAARLAQQQAEAEEAARNAAEARLQAARKVEIAQAALKDRAEREAEMARARAKELAEERSRKEAEARELALDQIRQAQERQKAVAAERKELEQQEAAMQQRLVVAREEVAKASLKAEEAKRLERTEAALLHNAGGKPEQIAASTAAELENGAIGVALAALAAYRQQDDQSVDETRRQSAVERLAAARKRAEARKRAASEAASQAAATASRVDLTPKAIMQHQTEATASVPAQNTKEEKLRRLNEARKRAEERRSAERAAAEAAAVHPAAVAGDDACKGEESGHPPPSIVQSGHPALAHDRAAAARKRAEEQRTSERAAAEAAEMARQRSLEDAAKRRELEAKRKIGEVAKRHAEAARRREMVVAEARAAEARAAEARAAEARAAEARAAEARAAEAKAAEAKAAEARAAQAKAAEAKAAEAKAAEAKAAQAKAAEAKAKDAKAKDAKTKDAEVRFSRAASSEEGCATKRTTSMTFAGSGDAAHLSTCDAADGDGTPTSRSRMPLAANASNHNPRAAVQPQKDEAQANALARAKQEADAFLAAKQRLAQEARERRVQQEAEKRRHEKEELQRRRATEEAMSADITKCKAVSTTVTSASALSGATVPAPAVDQHVWKQSHAETAATLASPPQPPPPAEAATLKPVALAQADLQRKSPTPSPVHPSTALTARRPTTAPSARAVQNPEVLPTAAPSVVEAASVARRLAAAKANPQLAKTLDPNSPLADNYSLLGVLGKGSYGEVRLSIHKLTKQRVAVKTLSRAKLSDEKLRKRAAVETKLHQKLRHPNIARLYEVISSPSSICLCMQYASGGTLRDLLDQHGALSEPRARRYLQQMCGALHYCHKKAHVVHRDLKLDNMLLTGSDEILLADFGFAEYVGPSNKRLRLLCGSPHYSAPEIFAQQEYSGTAADMWSLGVLMYTMLAGHFPFQAESMEALGKKVMKGRPDKPLRASPQAVDLVQQMLVVRASQRATIDGVCDATWLAPSAGESQIHREGFDGPCWDDGIAARLEAMGCPAALAHHHVMQSTSGTANHVTAAYEMLLQAEPQSEQEQHKHQAIRTAA